MDNANNRLVVLLNTVSNRMDDKHSDNNHSTTANQSCYKSGTGCSDPLQISSAHGPSALFDSYEVRDYEFVDLVKLTRFSNMLKS